jgi:hypothetical protein
MDNTTNSILNFFLDKSKSIGVKTALTISILGLLLFVDLGLGLSYNFGINNKLTQLKSIQYLKKSYAHDSLKTVQLKRLEMEVINRNHYSYYLQFDFPEKNDNSIIPVIDSTKPDNRQTVVKPSAFWMIVSSNYSFLLMWPVIILLPLFPDKKRQSNFFTGWIAMNILWISLMTVISFIAFQIPIISDNIANNYWLNFGIHTLFLVIIFAIGKKKK